MPSLSIMEHSLFSLPFRRKKQRYTINPPDDDYNVIYLGNVLTIIGKGEASVEKPLSLIWKTYCQRGQRADMPMKLSVTRSGLKAETKQQGLTEYWAHRVTYCQAPTEYPRVFCWVYKHEGRKMKPELRCHAVLCKKNNEPSLISVRLTDFLASALQEYKREKLTMEKARKNGISSGVNGPCPLRKQILQTGSLNFRPPICKNKSASRLGSIDEEEEVPEEKTIEGIVMTPLSETRIMIDQMVVEEEELDEEDEEDDESFEQEHNNYYSKKFAVECLPSSSTYSSADSSECGETPPLVIKNKGLRRNFSLSKSRQVHHQETLGKVLKRQCSLDTGIMLNNTEEDLVQGLIGENANYKKESVADCESNNAFLQRSRSISSIEDDEAGGFIFDAPLANKSDEDDTHFNDPLIEVLASDLEEYVKNRTPSAEFESSNSSCSSIDDGFGSSASSQFPQNNNKRFQKQSDPDCVSDESGFHEESFKTIATIRSNVRSYTDYEVTDL
uniref:PID domain-containing protein n=1 Tax=Rhabditophanes sp. KR3021 TaxID=114890 RepID=A0AC35UH63_9BILA